MIEPLENRKEQALRAIEALKQKYPDAVCSLTYEKPYELLISTRLSAQCTDKRVNEVTGVLYGRYPTLQSLADASIEDLEEIIRPCGLFHTKARDIKALSRQLIEKWGGELPDTLEGLTSLPGIGRKTANLVLGMSSTSPASSPTPTASASAGGWGCRRGRTLIRWRCS